MIETIDPEKITNSAGHLRLWDGDTHHHLWSNHSEPASERRALVDVLAERVGWTAATFDWPNRGRVWAGSMRLNDTGGIEAKPAGFQYTEEFVEGVYGDLAANYEANPPRAEEIAGPIEVDPWSDGWKPGQWWRVVLTDGTVWSESSDHGENVAKLRAIRGNEITVYPPGHPDGKRYGPDPGAQLQRRYERAEHTWRDQELAGE